MENRTESFDEYLHEFLMDIFDDFYEELDEEGQAVFREEYKKTLQGRLIAIKFEAKNVIRGFF